MKHLISTFVALASALGCGAAEAQISNGTIKLGVLNDMSSLYSRPDGG